MTRTVEPIGLDDGACTAYYIAIRAHGDPDSFLPGYLAVRRILGELTGAERIWQIRWHRPAQPSRGHHGEAPH